MQSITVGGNTYNLVAMPATPGPAEIEIAMNDAVAVVTSPFTRQEQTQTFPGGDFWDAMITLPPLSQAKAWPWEGFLAELRGRLNVFQCGDPRAAAPQGSGLGAPVVAQYGDIFNVRMTWVLATSGWAPAQSGLLLPADYFQIGYRLHRVCEPVISDAYGNATLTIWPSLRETPENGTPLNLNFPQGLFRLASNRRAIHSSKQRLTTISMSFVEAK
jgi:hypothetical protein